jgi:SagB-type dehydrogenase family enzyme
MDSIGYEFIKKTNNGTVVPSDQGRPKPLLQLEADENQPVIALPKPQEIKTGFVDLRLTIEQRTSIRDYQNIPLTINEFSYLLWCTQGVNSVHKNSFTKRNVPSAGARHALETYLLINNIEGINPGLYRFLAIEHSLISVSADKDIADRIIRACSNQSFIKSSAVTFIWAAVQDRMTWRYGDRGFRYMLLDAGHICQNLYLSAESINCGTCAIGAFSDDELNSVLGLDGREMFVIYLATVGKK